MADSDALSQLQQWLSANITPLIATDTPQGLALVTALLLLVSWLGFKVSHYLLQGKITKLIFHSKTNWDDELHKQHFFTRCTHVVPAVLVFVLAAALLPQEHLLTAILQKLAGIYLMLSVVLALFAILNSIHEIYNQSRYAKRVPITGFIQIAKLLLSLITILLIISSLLNKSPLILLSGLGALTAILILVFRDAILGFVAGVQIVANRMVNTGDWIEVPKYGADGNVLALGLTTVKVQNWDKTISMIPTHVLISDGVKNWKGMELSGGRRIKRALHLDLKTVTFATPEQLEAWQELNLLAPYLKQKLTELAYQNQAYNEPGQNLNARKLTNLGTYRAYALAYLKHHPQVRQDMTLLVRQLQPTEVGLPLEIYCFCNDTAWGNYEAIQADIFDHLIAMLQSFGLRAYQRTSDGERV